MSIQQIQQKMEKLKLNHTLPLISELLSEATKQKSNTLEFFEKLLTLEVEAREESRIAASLKVSALPKGMHLDNFDFLFQPSVDKSKIQNLSTCEFIRSHENVLFFGPPGVGNYRKFLFMERKKNICLFYTKYIFISFHNISQ